MAALFFRQASAALAALQDNVFSAVHFQRKAAKQNGNGLSQQMDGLSETRRTRFTVPTARRGAVRRDIRTPAVSVKYEYE